MPQSKEEFVSAIVQGEEFSLFSKRALFWRKESTLLVADLHLGKINHFRRAGIPVPVRANERNLEILIDLINLTKPDRFICLGDLFHSHYNEEWEIFGNLVQHFSQVSFELVSGNHDIMSDVQYERKGITVYEELSIGPFDLTHHPQEDVVEGRYNLAGHIHPGIQLRGKGRQSATLPCFYFGKQNGLLPAFGMFTGMARIRPKKDDQVFVITEELILSMT